MMKYLFSDFYLLTAIQDKKTQTVGDAYRKMSALMGIPVRTACLRFALRGLTAGGYVKIGPENPENPENGVISEATPISVTDAGKKAASVSGLRKLLGEAKAFNKNELNFCSLDRPGTVESPDQTIDAEGFGKIADDMMLRREIGYPLFDLTDAGEGLLTLTVHHPNDSYSPNEDEEEAEANPFDPDAAEYAYSASVTGDAQRILQGMSDLIAAAHALLTQPAKTRKIGLHGADKSLIVTLARAASEYGTVLRMTVEQIRFNRQRFYGKRDSELDYAQCGDPIILHEMNSAAGFAALLLPCAVALPERLGEEDLSLIASIHQILKK